MTAKTEITSIPSPFARIALVKNAFLQVTQNPNGNTIYHKLVSDSLDVAEIIFNWDRLKNLFKILVWDEQRDLAALQNSHQEMYYTLDTYLRQDAPTYNFDRMQNVYILVYVGQGQRSQMGDVVGATSPASLFFTPANDLSYISQYISFGQDHPFDTNFQPLYQRDSQFVEYLFAFRQGYPQFANDFPEVNAYLDHTFAQLPDGLKNTIANLDNTALRGYQPLVFNATDRVDILGQPYHKKPVVAVKKSDFFIAQSHYKGAVQPLVLPVESGTTYANLHYVVDTWGRNNRAPYRDDTPWTKRTLPHDGTPHPYLTIDDFLEDTILYYPRTANEDQFFFGNWNAANGSSVMLPVKPLFFEFFTADQLKNGINGVPMLKMTSINGGDITVELNIPIAGGTITYTRNYYRNSSPDIDRNRGAVKDITTSPYFGIAMLPMVQCPNPFYRIAIVHDFSDHQRYTIECYSGSSIVNGVQEIVRNRTDQQYPKIQIFTNDTTSMDYVRVGVGDVHGIIMPLYNVPQKNLNFLFAVDFGTTNTHIEYTSGGAAASEFKDCQVTLWADFAERIEPIIEGDLITLKVGDRFRFPTRTVLSEMSATDWSQPVIPMAQTNVPLIYGHRKIADYNTITTDLKWSNDTDNSQRVKSYIENLMIMMRNKVLLEGGNLANTKIIWFYPGSMTTGRLGIYQTAWSKAYNTYFGGGANNISCVLESVAPYEYFRLQTPAASRMVSIDIGGGTSDVVIAEKGRIIYTTSFRFAANSIFGDGYTQGNIINGLVDSYMERYEEMLERNGLLDLSGILQQLRSTGVSADIASFLFATKSDDRVIERNAAALLDWNDMLQRDGKYKIVFLLFYTAIIYHIAHIMHAKKMEMPRHIAFSGNGSRVVSVLSPNAGTLADYAKDVFCRVYGVQQYHPDGLDIILMGNPKAATCKGGLNILQQNNISLNVGQKVILKSHSEESFINQKDTYKVVDNLKAGVIKDIREFLCFTLESSNYNIRDAFDIDQTSIDKAKEVCYRDLDTFFENGIQQKQQENVDNDPIEEPLFFYPIIGMLHELCYHLNS